MTLTELKYLVALAKEKHFNRAAQSCFISQPTLSVAVKKLEDELGVQIFERTNNSISVTAQGEQIIYQALSILEQVEVLKDLAKKNADPLSGPIKIGMIFTIAPYLLPELMPSLMQKLPNIKPILQENYTNDLLNSLRDGSIDCAIVAQPFNNHGLAVAPLYEEKFWVAIPQEHQLIKKNSISLDDLTQNNLLLLGKGHCWREQVLQLINNNISYQDHNVNLTNDSFSGSSLTTILYMVSAGLGLTLVPATSVPEYVRTSSVNQLKTKQKNNSICYLPLQHSSSRRVVLTWRRSSAQYKLMAELRNCIVNCGIKGVSLIN